MPYISRPHRKRLDPLIEQLAEELQKIGDEENAKEQGKYPAAYAGLLNYAVTRLVGKFTLLTLRYWTIALLTGVIENVKQEFYRRVVAPYEHKQRLKHGDVPEYEELERVIRNM